MTFKNKEQLGKGCGRGMQSGKTFCGNKHKKKDYILLCSKCLATLTQINEIIKMIEDEIDTKTIIGISYEDKKTVLEEILTKLRGEKN